MRPKDIDHIGHLIGISYGRNVFDESVNGALLRDVVFHVSWFFDNRRRTEEDMEGIFGGDITGLEVEDRDSVTFEYWLAEMIDWGRYLRVDEDDA